MASNFPKILTAALLVCGAAVPLLLAVEATLQPACDRACLLAITGSYLEAMLAHNPSARIVASDLKTTENGKILPSGEGLWKTAKAISSRRFFVDESAGETGLFGVITEQNGQSSPLVLRLKISRRRIQEAEFVVSREAAAGR